MKTRFIKLIGIICAITCLTTACTQADENQNDTQLSEQITESVTQESSNQNEEVPYWKLECRTIKDRSDIHFDLGDNSNLALSFAKDWVLEKSAEGGYDIKRDSKTIGRISKGSLESGEWTVADKYLRTINPTLKVNKFIEKNGTGSDVKYRYRFEYNCTVAKDPILISLCVDYIEIDVNAADRFYKSAEISSPTTVKSGMLSSVKDGNYLILGNSFIGTSNIGELLNDMFSVNNKPTHFNAVSRGYAQVGTYTADSAMMSSIESGDYDAVFICGFYANAEANNLVILENACKKSNTELVIFPAHNEFDEPIKLARNKCPNLKFLDWKGELDMLIADGVDKWDLCYDDEHKHSTAYAGLIGAHMMYRAIYGEIPTLEGMTSIDVGAAETLFGNYLKTGCVKVDYETVELD